MFKKGQVIKQKMYSDFTFTFVEYTKVDALKARVNTPTGTSLGSMEFLVSDFEEEIGVKNKTEIKWV